MDVNNFILATHPELRATKSSKAATTDADDEQIGSATADNNSPVQLYLAMMRDAGYRKSSKSSYSNFKDICQINQLSM